MTEVENIVNLPGYQGIKNRCIVFHFDVSHDINAYVFIGEQCGLYHSISRHTILAFQAPVNSFSICPLLLLRLTLPT